MKAYTTAGLGTIEDIICDYFDVNPADLGSPTRRKPVITARKCIIFYETEILGKSSKTVGNKYNRDHSTVIHNVRSVENYIQYDRKYRNLIMEIIGIRISQLQAYYPITKVELNRLYNLQNHITALP